MTLEQRNTPGGQTGGIHDTQNVPPGNSTPSIPDAAKKYADPDVMKQQLHGCYVVIAEIKSPDEDPRYRRRFYASLDSAQKAVDRAVANGRDTHLVLAQLHIVDGDVS